MIEEVPPSEEEIKEDSVPGKMSLLEESQEVVVFNSESKNSTPKRSQKSIRDVNEKLLPLAKEESKETIQFSQGKGEMPAVNGEDSIGEDINYINQELLHQKDNEARTDLHEDQKRENKLNPNMGEELQEKNVKEKEDNKPSSNEKMLLNNYDSDKSDDEKEFDIKKMNPYDQRKNPQHLSLSVPKNKLNILYEELEDSESELSEEYKNENPNHLASIIEEEEEATEYQRSRSRDKSLSPTSPNVELNPYKRNNNAKANYHIPQVTINDIEKEGALAQSQEKVKRFKCTTEKNQPPVSSSRVKPEMKASIEVPSEHAKTPIKPQARKKSSGTPLQKKSPSQESAGLAAKEVPEIQSLDEAQCQFETQSMKTPNMNPTYKEYQEASVKLEDHHSQAQSSKLHASHRNMRSPPARGDAEKAFTAQKALPKPLKFIFGILNGMGDEKTLEFHEFFHLYVVLSEIV